MASDEGHHEKKLEQKNMQSREICGAEKYVEQIFL